jgi:hypothetical protein
MTSPKWTLVLLLCMSLCAAVVYTSEDVAVWVEEPPNQSVRIFHVRHLLADSNSLIYPPLSPDDDRMLRPLGRQVARQVWELPGNSSMNIGRYYVLVEKGGAFTWDEMIPAVTKILEDTLRTARWRGAAQERSSAGVGSHVR